MLQKNEEFLQKLNEEIKAEKHKRKVAKRQRNMYAVLALVLTGGGLLK